MQSDIYALTFIYINMVFICIFYTIKFKLENRLQDTDWADTSQS